MRSITAPPVDVFARLAVEFCAWCEADALGTDLDQQAAIWLAILYAGALKLQNVEPETNEAKPEVPVEYKQKVMRNFSRFWGRGYRQIFDPRLENDEPPVVADLGDDLTDVYLDIKASLLLYERGNKQDAAWQWKFDYETHWGHHAVGALFGIHHLSVSGLA